jgi:hypothetical protein
MNTDSKKTKTKQCAIPSVIYWLLFPFRNSYKNKLKALLEGLETQNLGKLLKEGKTGDFRNYGKAYIGAVRDKVAADKTCR